MRYTEQRENDLFGSWMYESEEDDYSKVLDVLNTEFRSFGDGLLSLMEECAGKQIVEPIPYLKSMCEKNDIPISAIGSPNTLRNWFSGGARPKKGDTSRKAMFALAFALGLTTEGTARLFQNVYLDRAFNQRNHQEVIYYYCISCGLSFAHAESLIARVHFDEDRPSDKTMYTSWIAEEAAQSRSDEELLTFIQSHGHNFTLNSIGAKRILQEQKEKAHKILQRNNNGHRQLYDPKDYPGVAKTSDSFLYAVMTECSVTGRRGTVTVPFKNSTLPKEIKINFPQMKSLSGKTDSFEELRKTIILLFSFCFWYEAEENELTDFYDDYTVQLNALLLEANLPTLYYGNPCDWMFLYCTYMENPLDTFHGILSAALEGTETQ